MTRTLRRLVVVCLVALALFGLYASTAFATLEDTPTPTMGTSSSNPGWGADYWWRGYWGNTLYPDFELNAPGAWDEKLDGYLLGSIYTIDRTLAPLRSTYIDTRTPEAYYRDNFPTAITAVGGTLAAHTLDMLGIYMNPPSGSWPATETGAHSPLEGHWYYHYSFYSNSRYQYDSYTIPFGIDLTPPRAVTGLHVGTGLAHSNVTTWTPATRAYISWDASETDDLSGDGYFQVLVDDKPLVPETSATPTLGRTYQIPGLPTPSSITVENMPPGKHKVSIQPVDRATNVGAATSTYFYSDPDTPTISFTSPITNVLSTKTLFSVNANDLAGDPTVQFFFDGVATATISAPPYSFKPNLAGVSTGDHQLVATVTDHLNRTVTIAKTVSFNNVALSTGFLTNGAPWFDGPKDFTSVTNPLGDKWRVDSNDVAWGNSLHPDFTLQAGSEVASFSAEGEGNSAGMLYDVRRLPELIDATKPAAYFRSVRPMSNLYATHLDGTIDMASVVTYGTSETVSPVPLAAEQPVEGVWYLHYKAFTDLGWAESATNYVRFGIDLTPPTAPTGLKASPTTDTALAGRTTAGTRMHFTWLTGDYDLLSGVAYYQVLLDGVKVIPSEGGDDQGRVVDIPGRAEPAVTIENLGAGQHTFAVQAVDRAGNVGSATSTVVYSDPDTPTITITSPTGSVVGVRPTVSATAADQGGVVSVIFKLDGTTLAMETAAPYSTTVDLSGFSAGVAHDLTATVTDRLGRTVTAHKTITIDKTALTISSIKVTSAKRKVTIAFNVNRASTTKLSLSVAGQSKTVTFTGPARYTYSYTYPKTSSRYPSPLSFNETYAISASDSLGNSASASGKVKVLIARIVRVSSSKVQIVYY